jgi:hypothetical protein
MPSSPLSLEALRRATREGRAFSFLAFYGHEAGEPGTLTRSCLSQWWRSSFVVDGVEYLTAEQFMMAGKARLFGDGAALERILAEPNPAKVKRLGRGVRGFEDAVWVAHRFELVSFGSQEKFRQEAALLSFLGSTGEAILVEASPTDDVWGIGAEASSPVVTQPEAWRGLNLLGFALTRARGVLAGHLPEVPRGPWL